MARQVLNDGLSLTEGVLDKGNLTDLMAVINRSDANFLDLYAGSAAGGGAFDNTGTTLVSITIQAALVELSAKIDAINAALT